MDVVLINPSSRKQVYQSLGNELAAVEPPLWAALMASYCRKHGLAVAIIDAEAESLTAEEVAERVEAVKAALACVVVYGHQPSASTQVMTAAGMMCGALKENNRRRPILMMGG